MTDARCSAGSCAHNLPVYHEVDRCFGRARQGRVVSSQELVRIDMAPSARILVDNLDFAVCPLNSATSQATQFKSRSPERSLSGQLGR